MIQVFAIDDDEDAAGEVTYAIDSSVDCPDCFEINSQDGWITVDTSPLPSVRTYFHYCIVT